MWTKIAVTVKFHVKYIWLTANVYKVMDSDSIFWIGKVDLSSIIPILARLMRLSTERDIHFNMTIFCVRPGYEKKKCRT